MGLPNDVQLAIATSESRARSIAAEAWRFEHGIKWREPGETDWRDLPTLGWQVDMYYDEPRDLGPVLREYEHDEPRGVARIRVTPEMARWLDWRRGTTEFRAQAERRGPAIRFTGSMDAEWSTEGGDESVVTLSVPFLGVSMVGT